LARDPHLRSINFMSVYRSRFGRTLLFQNMRRIFAPAGDLSCRRRAAGVHRVHAAGATTSPVLPTLIRRRAEWNWQVRRLCSRACSDRGMRRRHRLGNEDARQRAGGNRTRVRRTDVGHGVADMGTNQLARDPRARPRNGLCDLYLLKGYEVYALTNCY
jgi:hypothetical protein